MAAAAAQARHDEWAERGFFLLRAFRPPDVGAAMLERVVEIGRGAAGQVVAGHQLVLPEQNLAGSVGCDAPAEQRISKIFRLHRDAVFRAFIESEDVLEIGRNLLASELDCFLSQFIFKNPGAWGQPWHQDALYFPFDRAPQVGLWLAVTEATEANGCLWVVPGSHRDPVHTHVPDRRPNANVGYMEVVDRDVSGAIPVCMQPGDLLVFHSHLLHRSKDNECDRLRAAMVYHLAQHGTRDVSGTASPVNDWMPLPGAT